MGLAYLARTGEKPLFESPEVAAAIAMDQGIRYLQIHRFDKAIGEFEKVLKIQPQNEIAYYNLACAYALKGDKERALEALERSVESGFEDPEHIEKDDDLASLRGEPRFQALVQKLKLKRATEDSEKP